MPVFLYISPDSGQAALDAALAFTRGDRFKPLPGYKVMGTHYHVEMVRRLRESGGLDNRLNDIEATKGAGIVFTGSLTARAGQPGANSPACRSARSASSRATGSAGCG